MYLLLTPKEPSRSPLSRPQLKWRWWPASAGTLPGASGSLVLGSSTFRASEFRGLMLLMKSTHIARDEFLLMRCVVLESVTIIV